MSEHEDTTERGLPALVYKGEVIHERHEMLSLTDMWKAAGGPDQKNPAKWRALPTSKAFVEHVGAVVGKSDNGLFHSQRGGADQGTWAHWQIAMAYAKYLDHDFHMWCNTVVRERMEGRAVAVASIDNFGPQARKVFGGIVKAVMPGLLAEALTVLLPAMVREHVGEQQHAVVQGVSAGQVLEMAGVGKRKGMRGMAVWVSHRLRRFHALRGVAVRMASLGSSNAYVFDPLTSREWLAQGGKVEIEQKIAERRGQGALRLV